MGLIETLEGKIDKLAQSELAAGIRNLDQACSSSTEAESLLREARSCFIKATGLEAGYRLGVTYLGLALCHSYLHDYENCIKILRKLLNLTPRPSLPRELYAKTKAETEGKNFLVLMIQEADLFPPFWLAAIILKNLKRVAAVTARRAQYVPNAIRESVQPSRREVILGIKADPDAYKLAKIQLLVSDHLGEAVEWMSRYGINSEDMGLEANGVELSVQPNSAPTTDA